MHQIGFAARTQEKSMYMESLTKGDPNMASYYDHQSMDQPTIVLCVEITVEALLSK